MKTSKKHGKVENAGYGLEFLVNGLEFLTLVLWTDLTQKARGRNSQVAGRYLQNNASV